MKTKKEHWRGGGGGVQAMLDLQGPSSSYYVFRLDKETRPWGRRARMKRCLLVEAGNYTHFFCFHKVNSLDQQLTVPQVTHN